ncbi:MAG: NAD-dependent malic enzyme [Cyanobacteriota bacterium]|nr:NAD-dependent malic enzyme [Cyanobacteriota bacterium]
MAVPTLVTPLRGAHLLNDPLLNKGTAFTRQERRALGLEALLPWQEETIEGQVERCWLAFNALNSDMERFAYLQVLRERNLTLFHRFLAEHIEAALPIVYTPTVGLAVQHFSHSYRSPSQGVYLAVPDQERLVDLLRQAVECFGPPNLLLITDAQGILGIGDQGVGGIQICLGKLAVYTLCAGLHPGRCLPVMLDVGTDRADLREAPHYPGWKQPRLSGTAYDAFLDAFIAAVRQVCPGALAHWEDFGAANARRVLDRYRATVPSFNDDIQGTSGVAAAVVLAGLRGLGQRLSEQTIVIFGAGSAGCGIAERLCRLLVRQGLTPEQAADRLWLLDRDGLVHDGLPHWNDAVTPYVKRSEHVGALAADAEGRIGLLAVIEALHPGVLIGTSTCAGAFDQRVVEALCRGVARPIVLPLSNPTPLAEVTPDNLLRWSEGRALVATGSPFPPVWSEGKERVIGQCNNCFVFPGLGYAAMAVGASQVSDAMIDACVEALAEHIPASHDPDAPLMPSLHMVREVSSRVAEAVALAALEEGLATRARTPEEALRRLREERWEPVYPTIQPG